MNDNLNRGDASTNNHGNSSNNSTTNDRSSMKSGIDIRLALDILMERSLRLSEPGRQHQHQPDVTNHHNGCSCHRAKSVSNHKGQIIDITATTSIVKTKSQKLDVTMNYTAQDDPKNADGVVMDDSVVEHDGNTSNKNSTKKLGKEEEDIQKQRRLDIEHAINSMSKQQLVQCILESQQQRVETYKQYDR